MVPERSPRVWICQAACAVWRRLDFVLRALGSHGRVLSHGGLKCCVITFSYHV
jgi:hypothetical protein